ncbi:MAG: sugar nucleotide-binding protein [Eubacteriales bacterium]|nr:sugar nucleotide-binding protein [Eubacteriales bacterium]
MKVFVLGASGYAGQAIARQLGQDHDVYGTYHTKTQLGGKQGMFRYELGDAAALDALLRRVRPQIVISSLTGDFPLQLAAHGQVADYLTEKADGKMIYLSTANVFDAKLDKPHYELDETGSDTDYGNFKIECEQLLQAKLGDRCILVRVPQIWGKNCPRIRKLTQDAQNHTPVVTYPNLYVNYTTNVQIAQWIAYIIEKELAGIFHIGTKDMYDIMRFQVELCRLLGLREPVFRKEPIATKCFQAVLPGRQETPQSLQMDVADVLEYLAKVQRQPL